MTRYRFYVGTMGASGRVSHAALRAYLVNVFGGYTAFAAKGAWWDDSKRVVIAEPSVVYEVLSNEPHSAAWIAGTLAEHAGQTCVLHTTETVAEGGFAYA